MNVSLSKRFEAPIVRPATRAPIAAARVLVTGFGPFPGIADNPSAAVAAALGRRRRRGPAIVAAVLSTEWRGLAALDDLLRTAAPDAVLHIGVAPRASRPRLELRAYNRAAALPDAVGARPPGRLVDAAGPAIRRVAAMPAGLARRGLARSLDPGAYLCNATLYRSLALSPARRPVAFLHIPPVAMRRGARLADLVALAEAVATGLVGGRQRRRLTACQSKSAPRAV